MERGLWQAIATRQIFPVLCGDALSNVGVDQLLSAVASCFPPPLQSTGLNDTSPAGDEITLVSDADQPLVAFVFKTTAEQHVGELSYLRL